MANLFGHLKAVHFALQEGFYHERIGAQFANLVHHSATVSDGVEQANLLLVLQQIAHVLRYLCDVFN